MKHGTEYLNKWGFEDPRMVGASEYAAIYECLSDALAGCEEDDAVADPPAEFAAAVLDEIIAHAQAMKKKVPGAGDAPQVDNIKLKVWAATIEHKHGTNIYVGRTEAALEQEIYGFVEAWWDSVFDEPMLAIPADHEKVIQQYFERVEAEEWVNRLGETEVVP